MIAIIAFNNDKSYSFKEEESDAQKIHISSQQLQILKNIENHPNHSTLDNAKIIAIPGNVGKTQALMQLAKQGEELVGIDLSCEANNGVWDDSSKECVQGGIYLKDLDLSWDNIGRVVNALSINFKGAMLLESNFAGVFLMYANFHGARIVETETVMSSFQYSTLHNANFDSAMLRNIDFREADLTGANFTSSYLENVKFGDNWNDEFFSKNRTEEEKRDLILPTFFSGSTLQRVEFTNTINIFSFKEANLYNVEFNNSLLYLTNFSDPTLRDVSFKSVVCFFCMQLSKYDF